MFSIKKAPRLASEGHKSGGESGIRTHGRMKSYNGFRDRPVQPLRHLSKCKDYTRLQVKCLTFFSINRLRETTGFSQFCHKSFRGKSFTMH